MTPAERPFTVNECNAVRIRVASPEEIRGWSSGEVTQPATFAARDEWKCRCGRLQGSAHSEQKCEGCGGPVKRYRSLSPAKGGLFCERVFGPLKDWECACGKVHGPEQRGSRCEQCQVEVNESRVRRQRLGHIELAAPVVHTWFHQARPSLLAILLDVRPAALNQVLALRAHMVLEPGNTPLNERQVLDEEQYRRARQDHGEAFRAGQGAEAVRELLRGLNLEDQSRRLRAELTVLLRAAGDEPGDASADEAPAARAGRVVLTRSEVEFLAALLRVSPAGVRRLLSFRCYVVLAPGSASLPVGRLLTGEEYGRARQEHGTSFEAGTGPEAIARLLAQLDPQELSRQLQAEAAEALRARLGRLGAVLGREPGDLEKVLTGLSHVVLRPGETGLVRGQLVSAEQCEKQNTDFRAETGAAALRRLLEPPDRAELERLSVLLGLSPGGLDQVLSLKAHVVLQSGSSGLSVGQVLGESEVRKVRTGASAELATGAAAIQALLDRLDLARLSRDLLQELTARNEQQLHRLSECLDLSTGSLVKVLSAQRYVVIDPGATDLKRHRLLSRGQGRKRMKQHAGDADPPRIATGPEAVRELVECLAPAERPADLAGLDEKQTQRLAALLGLEPARLKQVLSFQRFVVTHPANSGLKEGQLLNGEQYRKARKQHGDALQAATGGRAAEQLLALLDPGRLADRLRSRLQELARYRLQRLSTLLDLDLPSLEQVLAGEAHLVVEHGLAPLRTGEVLTEARYQEERRRHGLVFETATGSSALNQLLRRLDLGLLRRAAILLRMRPGRLAQIIGHEKHVVTEPGAAPLGRGHLLSEGECRAARARFEGFEAVAGVAAVEALLEQRDLPTVLADLRERLAALGAQARRARQEEVTRCLRLVDALRGSDTRPEWLVLERLPVLPPDLRPIRPLPARRRPGEEGAAESSDGDADAWVANDLNYLYQRIIAVSNRIRRFHETGAPDVIVHHERRALQQAVDALFDNAHCPQPMLGSNNQPLKSLTDLLQGKQGCFRQNLLGKRVDYSARSVIVVGPRLKLEQCGLPREIALELFQPFVIRRLRELVEHQLRLSGPSALVVAQLLVQSLLPRMAVKGREARVRRALLGGLADRPAPPDGGPDPAEAERLRQAQRRWARELLETKAEVVEDILREVMKEHLVLLNRAPTLHRMNVQAFEPLLVPGKAIQVHPMVCEGFGADFDGDTMAVHLPLSIEARVEAETLLTPAANLLSPANGRPIIAPSQDIVLGCYYLTAGLEEGSGVRGQKSEARSQKSEVRGQKKAGARKRAPVGLSLPRTDTSTGEGMIFSGPEEVRRAYEAGRLGVHARIQVRLPAGREVIREGAGKEERLPTTRDARPTVRLATTVGRVLFDQVLPPGMPFYDLAMTKKNLVRLLADCFERCGRRATVALVDAIKELGFREATRSGLSFVVEDLHEPTDKKKVIAETEKAVREVRRQYEKGQLTDQQRYDQVIVLWADAQDRLTEQLQAELKDDHRDGRPYLNAHYVMAHSGARSKWVQVRQLAALRGLMDRPSGERRTLEHPITSSLRQGLGILEFFLSTHGARKAGADKAGLPDAGYLTRKLVDVAQHVFISMDDCGTARGVRKTAPPPGKKKGAPSLAEQVVGRCNLVEVVGPDGAVLLRQGEVITRAQVRALERLKVDEVWVRSPLTCEAPQGVCRRCYGTDLATQALVEEGTPVGVIAAQSIGEPATQLAMKTKHTGGVAGVQNMVSALEQVSALFDAHQPARPALLAPVRGTVRLAAAQGNRTVAVEPVGGAGEARARPVPPRANLRVRRGQQVEAGEPLTDDPPSLHEMLRLAGVEAVQGHLLRELRGIYRGNGVTIDDRHFEVIITQMLHKVRVLDGGDTELLPAAVVTRPAFEAMNRRLRACVRIDVPHDSPWPAAAVVGRDLYEAECDRLRAEGRKPATHVEPAPARCAPLLLGITQAALQAESFLAAASFQRTTQVLAEAALAGKEDPLAGLKENVILGRLVPAGTGFPPLREAAPHPTADGAGPRDMMRKE